MAWGFETDPEYQERLDWARTFVREEVEPLDLVFPGDLPFTPPSETIRKIIDPLKQQVRDKGLWATHLEPELGGQGHGALKLSLLNEILGRSSWHQSSSAARRRTQATRRSSPSTARRHRRRGTSSRCSTARSSPRTR